MEYQFSSLEHAAAAAAEQFVWDARADGTRYVRLRDNAPVWLEDLVRKAHGEMLPDDWRYRCIALACDFLGTGGDEDAADEFADEHVDTYTSDRLAWLASHSWRAGYCDDVAEEFGATYPDGGIVEIIGWGQFQEARDTFYLVRDGLRELVR